MRTRLSIVCLVLALVGCDKDPNGPTLVAGIQDLRGACSESCSTCPPPPDLMPLGPNCQAANGLTGDRLICVDFNNASADLTGWSLSGWSVQNGFLQFVDPASFGTFTYVMAPIFIMPALNQQQFGKYNNFVLSVIHKVDISDGAGQKAQVMMGADDSTNRLVDQTTGHQPRKQWIHALAKGSVAGGTFQPWFKYSQTTTAGGAFRGWQIESIAVIGLP